MSKYERQAFHYRTDRRTMQLGLDAEPRCLKLKNAADQIHIEYWSAAMPGKWQLILRT